MAEHGGKNVIYGTICNVSVGATVRHNEQVFKAATGTTEPIRTKLQSWIGELMRKIQANLRATLALRHSYFPSLGKTVSIPMETFSFDSLWMSGRDGTGRDSFQFEFVCHFRFWKLERYHVTGGWKLETWQRQTSIFKLGFMIIYMFLFQQINSCKWVIYLSKSWTEVMCNEWTMEFEHSQNWSQPV